MKKQISDSIPLKELKNGSKFRIRKNGSVWIKIQEQGLYNHLVYAQSELKTTQRNQNKSYRHKYIEGIVMVFPV